jgi:hypothetical protein
MYLKYIQTIIFLIYWNSRKDQFQIPDERQYPKVGT